MENRPRRKAQSAVPDGRGLAADKPGVETARRHTGLPQPPSFLKVKPRVELNRNAGNNSCLRFCGQNSASLAFAVPQFNHRRFPVTQ
jgi:hypothetical protein